MSPAYRKLLKASRIAHVYLTLFGLLVIVFFAVTGFMLNHPQWFLPKDLNRPPRSGTVPRELLQPLDKLAVVEYIRRAHGVSGFLGGDPRQLDRDDAADDEPRESPRARDMGYLFPVPPTDPDNPTVEPVQLTFAQPGRLFEVKLWLADEPADPDKTPKKAGDIVINERTEGWAGVLLDLHKSKSSGRAWAWVVDITCGLLVVISATGLVLWSSLKTRGKWGAVLMLLGGAASAAVYFLSVP